MEIKLINDIPQEKPSFQIGPLSFWIKGHEIDSSGYYRSPILLQTENMVALARLSDIDIEELKVLRDNLQKLHENAGNISSFNFSPFEGEVSIEFKGNTLGHIDLNIKYQPFGDMYGCIEITEKIDQSYLPKIILELNQILK